jgi:hypothetical protein
MKFQPYRCPECKQLAHGTEETVLATALMNFDSKTNSFEYEGETKVHWNSQETITDEKGRVELSCPNSHSWFATVLPSEV